MKTDIGQCQRPFVPQPDAMNRNKNRNKDRGSSNTINGSSQDNEEEQEDDMEQSIEPHDPSQRREKQNSSSSNSSNSEQESSAEPAPHTSKASNGSSRTSIDTNLDKDVRHPVKPLPRLSTSLGLQFTIHDRGSSSVLQQRNPPFNSAVGSSFVDTMTQQLSIHVEQPVGSMSISPSSRDVVLAA